MAPKQKQEAPAAEEPPVKKAKVDEEDVKIVEEEKKETEVDEKADKRAKLKENVAFNIVDTTLNLIPAQGGLSRGHVLTSLTDGGMAYLLAGARANVGMTAGRFYYEVRIVEAIQEYRNQQHNQRFDRGQAPRQHIRVGVSLGGSSLLLDEPDCSVAFDAEGGLCDGPRRIGVAKFFDRDHVVGVLVNLEKGSPNENTISLFRNGERCSEPLPLPEALKGKPLFPHIAFRSVTVHANFGPVPLKPPPFKVRMVQEAAQKDVTTVTATKPKDGKHEVVFPVGMPDEGIFDWADRFIAANPDYTELSDRKIVDWTWRSGVGRNKGGPPNKLMGSTDKPSLQTNVPSVDDYSARRVLNAMSGVVPRNYVVMELKQNLIADERKENLKRFPSSQFKKVARVVVGEPDAEYKAEVQTKILEEAQRKADALFRLEKAKKEKIKAFELARKKEAIAKKKIGAEIAKKAAAEVAAKKAAEKEAAAKAGDGEEKEDEPMEDKAEEVEEVVEEEKAEVEPEEDDAEPPKVELTEEEKKRWHGPVTIPDLLPVMLNNFFGSFSAPSKDEGFDNILYEWNGEKESGSYIRDWVLNRKRNSRIDHIMPSEWFSTTYVDWQKSLIAWQSKQKEYTAKVIDADESDEPAIDIQGVEDVNNVKDGMPLYARFAQSDWILTSLRFELILLLEAFKRNDPDRIGIPEPHFSFYWNRFYKKNLNMKAFGKETLKDVFEFVKDSIKIEDGMICPANETDAPWQGEKCAKTFYLKRSEEVRRDRQRRLDAGDETAKISIAADWSSGPTGGHQGGYPGGKGGGKRGGKRG